MDEKMADKVFRRFLTDDYKNYLMENLYRRNDKYIIDSAVLTCEINDEVNEYQMQKELYGNSFLLSRKFNVYAGMTLKIRGLVINFADGSTDHIEEEMEKITFSVITTHTIVFGLTFK